MGSAARVVYLFVYVSDLAASRAFYEGALDLRLLEEDDASVKYDAGATILALNRAGDHGVEIGAGRDPTLLVFHVDDIDTARAALEGRGVEFDPTLRYEIGATAACYDPDGHCVTLYEPSPAAMGWPSGAKYQAILATGAPGASDPLLEKMLGKMVYVFLFVRDVATAFRYYHDALGLRILERDDSEGVVKYDGGGLILATHPYEGDATSSTPHSIAVVFHVDDVDAAFEKLSDRIVFATRPQRSAIGTTVKFEDPDGHLFYLYRASAEALRWPSGPKVEQILALGS